MIRRTLVAAGPSAKASISDLRVKKRLNAGTLVKAKMPRRVRAALMHCKGNCYPLPPPPSNMFCFVFVFHLFASFHLASRSVGTSSQQKEARPAGRHLSTGFGSFKQRWIAIISAGFAMERQRFCLHLSWAGVILFRPRGGLTQPPLWRLNNGDL